MSQAQTLLHHRRLGDDRALVTIARAGDIELDPPGITISVDDIYDSSGVN